VRTIAITNQKGGVGKTTTTANLGAALAERGKNVCLIDLDPQAHLAMHFGIDPATTQASMYDVLTTDTPLTRAAVRIEENLTVVPSVIDLAAAEVELAGAVGREQILRDRITEENLPYDLIIIDCPPSLGLLTLNSLAAADEVLIPLQPHFLALQGLGQLLETVSLVRRRINPALAVAGVIFCMFETGTRLSGEVVDDVRNFFASARGGDAPWSQAHIFQTRIRRNVKLAECPSYGTTIRNYDPLSHGAEDYAALADEFLTAFINDADDIAAEPIEQDTAVEVGEPLIADDEVAAEPIEPQAAQSADTPQ
jgi:chromosome partitioning protein